MAVLDRVKSAWNAFLDGPEAPWAKSAMSYGNYSRPDQNRYRSFSNEKTIITSIYTRMSIDVSGVGFRHIALDEQNRFKEDLDSALNDALTLEPNLDQGPRSFRQDIAMTLFDKGCAAIVPVDTTTDPTKTELFDIHTLRVGEIVEWYPKHVKVSLYNEATGVRQEITLEKRFVAIVANPLYSVMNEPNGTLQRLIRKLTLLDAVDEQSSSGKLDLIIQLPYVVKSEARKKAAEERRENIQLQLKDSQYGIAYTDATEKITQLNRPAENNLLGQVEWLTKMLYGQLGITEEVMNGTADEAAMLNYYNRSVDPILQAITEAMQRAFIGPVNTKKGERIQHFRDPFKLVPVSDLAEIADKFTRNEILTSNEIRGFMGIEPFPDDKADQLNNSNMPQPELAAPIEAAPVPTGISVEEVDSMMEDVFGTLEAEIDKISGGLDG
jgi:putative sterol carrier protein